MSTTQPPLPSTPHALAPKAVLEALAGDPDFGLTSMEVAARLASHGRNSLPERPGKSAWLRFLLQFHQPLIYVLLAASLITALLEEWVDSSVILGVVLINAVVGYLPAMQAVFGTTALTLEDWFWVLTAAAAITLAASMEKWLRNR